MKKIILITFLSLEVILCFAQAPTSFNYQAVIRDASGNILTNQSANIEIGILQGSIAGTPAYVETFTTSTNALGIVNLQIGSGTVVSGSFSTLNWSNGPYFLKIKVNGTVIGTSQLLSVPYALYSNKTNTGAKFEIKGNSSLSPDTALFEVRDRNGNVVFAVYEDGAELIVNPSAKGAKGGFVVGGRTTTKSNTVNDLMLITPDSVRFYIDNSLTKGSKGGFAIGGKSGSKGSFQNYLNVTQDSTRIYTADTIKGFGVGSQNSTGITSYLRLSPLNYFIGQQSGDNVTLGTPHIYSGKYNSVVGYQAGMNISSGAWNSFLGFKSGMSNTTGIENNGIGAFALYLNTIGNYNTANGVMALYSNDTGSYNTASGAWALSGNTSGSFNTGYGGLSLEDNTTGSYNTANGSNSMLANTTGSFNTANGAWAMRHNTTGENNTAVGTDAINFNTTGSYNTGLGSESLVNNTAGENNAGIGYSSLYTNLTGNDNTAVGSMSLYFNDVGSQNTATGMDALYSNTGGDKNTASGYQSLFSNTSGTENTSMGTLALSSNITGNYNTATGYASIYSNSLGSYNTAFGWESLEACTGSGNTAVGYSALATINTGNNNTAIGNLADVNSTSLSNATVIGYNSKVNASNMMVFGNSQVTNWGFGISSPTAGRAFQVGSNSSNGNGAYLSNGGVWTNGSDRNKKENFTPVNGLQILDLICQLPITRWNYIGEDVANTHIGPMAQDFYQLFKVGYDDKSITTIDPSGIALVAIKELIKQNEELKQKNKEAMKAYNELVAKDNQLQKDIQEIKEMLKQKRL